MDWLNAERQNGRKTASCNPSKARKTSLNWLNQNQIINLTGIHESVVLSMKVRTILLLVAHSPKTQQRAHLQTQTPKESHP